LCEDPGVIGAIFYIMELARGRPYANGALPEFDPPTRQRIYAQLVDTLADLHSIDPEAAELGDFGKPGNYFERQVMRWTRQYRDSQTDYIPEVERLIAFLPETLPEQSRTSIVHGDYRIDNVVFHPTEPRILAVLDWELSTLGHPLADFAYHCMTWRMPEGAHARGLAGADFAALGIPTEREYVAMYCRRTGRDRIDHFEYYLAYNMFRLAAILQGVMARALQGNAASAEALEAGRRTRAIAEEGWRQVERMLATRT